MLQEIAARLPKSELTATYRVSSLIYTDEKALADIEGLSAAHRKVSHRFDQFAQAYDQEIRKSHSWHHRQIPRTRECGSKTTRNSICLARSPLRSQQVNFCSIKSAFDVCRKQQANHTACFVIEGASDESRNFIGHCSRCTWEVSAEVRNGQRWFRNQIGETSDCQVEVLGPF